MSALWERSGAIPDLWDGSLQAALLAFLGVLLNVIDGSEFLLPL